MLLFRHGQDLIMAQLHIDEADYAAVGRSAEPHPRICQRAKPDLVQIRLHVQQKPASGHKIHLQNMVGQRRDGCEIPSVQVRAVLSVKIKIHSTDIVRRIFWKNH